MTLSFARRGLRFISRWSLSADNAGVEVNYVAFDNPSDDPEANSRYLAETLQASRIVRTERPLING